MYFLRYRPVSYSARWNWNSRRSHTRSSHYSRVSERCIATASAKEGSVAKLPVLPLLYFWSRVYCTNERNCPRVQTNPGISAAAVGLNRRTLDCASRRIASPIGACLGALFLFVDSGCYHFWTRYRNMAPKRLAMSEDPEERRFFSHWNSAMAEWAADGFPELELQPGPTRRPKAS